jgi:hypothetical protein
MPTHASNLTVQTRYFPQSSSVVTHFLITVSNLLTSEGWTAWLTVPAREIELGSFVSWCMNPEARNFYPQGHAHIPKAEISARWRCRPEVVR